MFVHTGLAVFWVDDTPYALIGEVSQIEDRLLELREMHGVSYVSVFEGELEEFAPVVRPPRRNVTFRVQAAVQVAVSTWSTITMTTAQLLPGEAGFVTALCAAVSPFALGALTLMIVPTK